MRQRALPSFRLTIVTRYSIGSEGRTQVCPDVVSIGRKAVIAAGLPLPPVSLSTPIITMAPIGGSWSRLARFSRTMRGQERTSLLADKPASLPGSRPGVSVPKPPAPRSLTSNVAASKLNPGKCRPSSAPLPK